MRKTIRRIKFALKYMGNPPWDTGQTPPEIIEHVRGVHPGKALDVGCGTGTNVIYLAERGWTATGIDFIPKAIRTATRKAARLDLATRFYVKDITQPYDLGETFDFIYDIGCFHSLPETGRDQYIKNLIAHLNPNGYFMIYGWLKDSMENDRGIQERDIRQFNQHMELIERTDTSERGRWPSVWMKFQRVATSG